MFGFSISEIIFLAVLALVVIGPKQLPEVARTLARFLNELKRSTKSLTDEFKIPEDINPMKPMKRPPAPTVTAQQAFEASVPKTVEKPEPAQLELVEQTPHKDSSST